jgi:hypothetical protein
MLAKLNIPIPFELTMPDGAEYRLYSFKAEGFEVKFDMPGRLEKPPASTSTSPAQVVLLDDKPAIQADILRIEFRKEAFERRIGTPIDPPEAMIQEVLDYFIGRLRYASSGFQVRPTRFPNCLWSLQYLNDDATELAPQPGYLRVRGSVKQSISLLVCEPRLWDFIFSLPSSFEPPAWHTLLLDSRASLPHVGTVVVLAATALEVFIAGLLAALVHDINMPDHLWEWINDRDNDHYKQPSVAEQFDTLLRVITGHSLKEESELWKGFQELKSARNNFVHRGVARVGKASSDLSENEALALIGQADAIVAKIREWIPEEHRWPLYSHKTRVQFTMPLNPHFVLDRPPVTQASLASPDSDGALQEPGE